VKIHHQVMLRGQFRHTIVRIHAMLVVVLDEIVLHPGTPHFSYSGNAFSIIASTLP
jgi:hypothetical protein